MLFAVTDLILKHQSVRPNPFDFATTIAFFAHEINANDKADIRIFDISGKLVKKIKLDLKEGLNEVLYQHGYGKVGHYVYAVYINDTKIASKTMVYAN